MLIFDRLINQKMFLPVGAVIIKALHCCFMLEGFRIVLYSYSFKIESFSVMNLFICILPQLNNSANFFTDLSFSYWFRTSKCCLRFRETHLDIIATQITDQLMKPTWMTFLLQNVIQTLLLSKMSFLHLLTANRKQDIQMTSLNLIYLILSLSTQGYKHKVSRFSWKIRWVNLPSSHSEQLGSHF